MKVPPAFETSAVAPRLDKRPHERRVGLIVLATDHTSEADFRRMVAGERIGVFATRVAYANPTTPENLMRMQPALAQAASLLLPGEPLDAVCYSCTSASAVIGEGAVAAAIHRAKPGVPVVTPPGAAARALAALGARRISILTPYTQRTSAPVAQWFASQGFEIQRATCLGMEDDREMARVAPASLVQLAVSAAAPGSDALFVSCTALRAAAAVAAMEDAAGLPVVTSNQATAWNCLRLCGDDGARPQWGRLMTLPLEAG